MYDSSNSMHRLCYLLKTKYFEVHDMNGIDPNALC